MLSWVLCLFLQGELKFVQPQEMVFAGITAIELDADYAGKELIGVELLVNGRQVHFFDGQPFETEIDFTEFPQGPISLRAVLTLLSGEEWVAEIHGTNYPRFHEEDVMLVRIPVFVKLERGHRVLNLDEFVLSEDGEAQDLDYVHSQEQPLNATVLLDLSGSMENRLRIIRVALFRFIELLRPQDQIQIIGFNHRVFEICPPETDKEKVKGRLYDLQADGATNIFGAVWSGIKVLGSSGMRRALVLFTDGFHDMGKEEDFYEKNMEDCINLARRYGVPVYAIGAGIGVKPEDLQELTDATGGALFYLSGGKAFHETFEVLGRELQYQYLVCYRTPSRHRGWRDIDVLVPSAPEAEVRFPRKVFVAGPSRR